MKRIKLTVAVCMILTLILSLTACGTGNDSTAQTEKSPSDSKQEEKTEQTEESGTYVLKLATSMSKEEAIGQQMEILADKIN